MQILYITSTFPKLSETFILEQITGLIDLGHEVDILAFYKTDEKIFHDDIEKYNLLAKTIFVQKSENRLGFKLTPEVSRVVYGADIIHAHFAALPAETAMAISGLTKAPFIFTAHAYDIFVHTNTEKLKELAETAARIITISEFNKQFIVNMLGNEYADRIEIIRCGIPVAKFSPLKKKDDGIIKLLTVGRLVEKKGTRYAIDAFSKIARKHNVEFRIIGEGPLMGELYELVKNHKLIDKVRFLGPQPQARVIREMQDADIFILSAVTAANGDKEGLPVVLLEAQAMKLPVVSSFHTGIPEAVLDGKSGFLVPEKDINLLAQKLECLIVNRQLREEMGEYGRRHVESRFNIQTELARLNSLMVSNTSDTRSKASLLKFTKNEKIKILFISHSSNFFGAEQSFLFLLQHLDRNLFEPVVVLPAILPEEKDTLFKGLSELGCKIVVIEAPAWIGKCDTFNLAANLFDELSAVQVYKDLIERENIDVVYTNTITRLAGAIAAKLAGKPHVWHIREVLEDHPIKSPFGLEATFRLVEYLTDKLITNSNYVADQFAFAPAEKISVVYNAVDTGTFINAVSSGRLRKELGVGMDCPLIGIIGSIHRHKNHEDLIRAVGRLNKESINCRLVVIGQADSEYKPYLLEIIDELEIGDSVSFLEFRNDMPEVFSELDLVVVASLAEPFGRTTIEAMAAGKPVVATNTGASPEIVVDGVTGYLVPPRVPEKMAEAIKKLLCDPEAARNMGLAGRDRVLKLFTKENYVSGVEKVFKNIHAAAVECPSKFVCEEYNKIISDMLMITGMDDWSKAIKTVVDNIRQTSEMQKLVQALEGRIGAMNNSLSWRITAPMRKFVDWRHKLNDLVLKK